MRAGCPPETPSAPRPAGRPRAGPTVVPESGTSPAPSKHRDRARPPRRGSPNPGGRGRRDRAAETPSGAPEALCPTDTDHAPRTERQHRGRDDHPDGELSAADDRTRLDRGGDHHTRNQDDEERGGHAAGSPAGDRHRGAEPGRAESAHTSSKGRSANSTATPTPRAMPRSHGRRLPTHRDPDRQQILQHTRDGAGDNRSEQRTDSAAGKRQHDRLAQVEHKDLSRPHAKGPQRRRWSRGGRPARRAPPGRHRCRRQATTRAPPDRGIAPPWTGPASARAGPPCRFQRRRTRDPRWPLESSPPPPFTSSGGVSSPRPHQQPVPDPAPESHQTAALEPAASSSAPAGRGSSQTSRRSGSR